MNKLQTAQTQVNAIFSKKMALTKKGRGGLSTINLNVLRKSQNQQTANFLRGAKLVDTEKRYNSQSIDRIARLIASNDLNRVLAEAKFLMQLPQAFLFTLTGCVWELTARKKKLIDGIYCGQDSSIDLKLDFLFDVFPDIEYLTFEPTGKTEGKYSEFKVVIEEEGEENDSNN